MRVLALDHAEGAATALRPITWRAASVDVNGFVNETVRNSADRIDTA
jgi:hypothetical protein